MPQLTYAQTHVDPSQWPPLASARSRSHPSPPRPAVFFPPKQAPGGSLPCTPQSSSPAPRARCRGRSDRLGDPGTVRLSHGPAPAAEQAPGAKPPSFSLARPFHRWTLRLLGVSTRPAGKWWCLQVNNDHCDPRW